MDIACLSVVPERWAKRVDNSRGSHTTVSMGLSLGSGSTVSLLSGRFGHVLTLLKRPGQLKISSKRTSKAVGPLVKHPAMGQLAGYLKGELRSYC